MNLPKRRLGNRGKGGGRSHGSDKAESGLHCQILFGIVENGSRSANNISGGYAAVECRCVQSVSEAWCKNSNAKDNTEGGSITSVFSTPTTYVRSISGLRIFRCDISTDDIRSFLVTFLLQDNLQTTIDSNITCQFQSVCLIVKVSDERNDERRRKNAVTNELENDVEVRPTVSR
jgi:hypothetical protein